VTTIGGGIVAETGPSKRSTLSGQEAAILGRILAGSAAEAANAVIAGTGTRGITAAELAVHTSHTPAAIEPVLASHDVVRIGTACFAATVIEDVIIRIVADAERMHRENPLRPNFDRSELRNALRQAAPELVEYAIEAAISRGDLTVTGGLVRRTGFQPTLSERQTAARGRLLAALEEAGLAAPTISELAGGQGNEAETVLLLRLLEQDGAIQAVNSEIYVPTAALAAARDRVIALAGKELAAADFRTALPVSRKYLIPLLEYFDRVGVTRRNGDVRTIVARSEAGSREAS
jgi:selenocysteine-specific elongation factor